ncbi:MAG: hypothetical protein HC817_02780 [Saprospiraceae bacterium]|nr:hypothetical protein [Saprospiraceae bacterium]
MGRYFLLVALTASVHQYLTVMVMFLVLASMIDLLWRRVLSFIKLLTYGLGYLATVALVFFIWGNFVMNLKSVETVGFGKFSANLNAYFNSDSHSFFVKSLPSTDGQSEGFGYLGLGVFVLIASILPLFFSLKKQKLVEKRFENTRPLLFPLILTTAILTFYSFSNKVFWGNTLVFEWHFGKAVAGIFNALRGSGRFIWVSVYLIMVFTMAQWLIFLSQKKYLRWLFALILIVQIVDLQPLMWRDRKALSSTAPFNTEGYEPFVPLFSEAERVITFPPYSWDIKGGNDFFKLARASAYVKKPITVGYFARSDFNRLWIHEANLYKEWASGSLGENDKSIFIGNKTDAHWFGRLLESGLVEAFDFQGYVVVVPEKLTQTRQFLREKKYSRLHFRAETVAEFLTRNTQHTILISAKEEASSKLDSTTRQAFANLGATEFKKIGRCDAYFAILTNGKCMFEKWSATELLEKSWKIGDILRADIDKTSALTIKKDIKIISAGCTVGSISAAIFVGSERQDLGKRGLNCVVLDANQNVIEVAGFDVFSTLSHTFYLKKPYVE